MTSRLTFRVAIVSVVTLTLGACQVVHRTSQFIGLNTGISLKDYKDVKVGVLPIVINPAFTISRRDSDAIRELIEQDLRVVYDFDAVSATS
jgi:hypothetical protein